MKKLMLGLFIAFGISACSLSNDDLNVDCGSNVDVSFTGFPLLCNYSVKTLPNNPVAIEIKTEKELLEYFTKHTNTCPNPSDPTIDFTKYELIAIFAGAKPTSGYAIKMTSIVENNCEIVINFFEKAPQTGEAITSTPTYPADYILIPKTSKRLFFNRASASADNIVIGSFASQCAGGDCQKFFQLNDYSVMKFLNVVSGSYEFGQYKFTSTTKKDEYTLFAKNITAEISALKGQTKTFGSPNTSAQGGVYFELHQGAAVTKIYIDNEDTADQTAAIKAFKKAIQDKITALNK
jgi:hypothetical protein